jgi:hypothetical protein
MRSKTEQIQQILQRNTQTWARSLLAPGEDMADHQYSDFISVTPAEVVAYVLANGFDVRGVWTPNHPRYEKDDKLVVEPQDGRWVCYYTERGDRSEEQTWDTQEEAVRDAVMRLMSSAWTLLNVPYWHRHHPELPRLPDFGQPWTPQP